MTHDMIDCLPRQAPRFPSHRLRSPIGALLAATATSHGLTLATPNVADFDGTGVLVVNPWDAGRR